MKIRGLISGNPFRFPIMALLVLFIAVGSFTFGINRDIATAATLSQGTLLTGTGDETPYYIINSGVTGTIFMIVGGTHGNEVAGYSTADLARNFVLNSGKLIIVPKLCIYNINNNRRTYPLGHEQYYCGTPLAPDECGDPNRYFPRPYSPEGANNTFSIDNAYSNLADALVSFILVNNPKWLVDLHESIEYNAFDSGNFGQTIIQYYNSDIGADIVELFNDDLVIIDGLDEESDEYAYKSFCRLSPGAEGSISRAVNHTWDDDHPEDKVAFMVETASNSSEPGIPAPLLAERIKHQLRVIKWSLVKAGLINATPVSSTPTLSKSGRTITVKYTATGGLAPFRYYLQRKKGSTGTWAKIYEGTSVQFVNTVTSAGTYYFRVRSQASDTATFGTTYGVYSAAKSIVIY